MGDCRTWCSLPAQAVVQVRDVVAFLRPDHPEDRGNLASRKRPVHAVPRCCRLQPPRSLRALSAHTPTGTAPAENTVVSRGPSVIPNPSCPLSLIRSPLPLPSWSFLVTQVPEGRANQSDARPTAARIQPGFRSWCLVLVPCEMEPSVSIVRPFLGFWLAYHGLSREGFLSLLQLPWSCLPTAVGRTWGRHHKERNSPNQGVYPLHGLPTMPEGV